MTSARRGLTLLEVLLASAILAMLAAACGPTIARAMSLLRPTGAARSIELIDLANAADVITAKPDIVGMRPGAPLHEITQMDVSWPAHESDSDHQVPPPIQMRVLPQSNPPADHCWIAFDCDGLTVYRWVSIPDETAAQGDHQ